MRLDMPRERLRECLMVYSEPGLPSPTGVRIPVDIRRLPWARRLASDYAYNFSRLAPFFAGNPAVLSDWQNAIAHRHAHPSPARQMVDVLRAQQQQRHAPPEALAATNRLSDPRTIAIVTGQQAGLFGGPLFTLLKALTTIRLADQVSQRYELPTVAVFWIDAEDHDWEEVRSCGVLDANLQRREISLPPRAAGDETPAGTVRLDASIETAIDELASAMASSEFNQSLLAELRAAYSPGARFVEAFGRWLEAILGRRGLIVFDGSDPAAKPLASQIFDRELRTPGRTSALAAASGADLVARGYHAQVSAQPDSVALFHLDGVRRPIRSKGDGFAVGDASLASSALVGEATANPARFSPNVLLRPIVQDTLFPTVCYVAGPNELAYLAQLKGIYTHFCLPMPLIYPRATATVIDSAAARFLARYDLPFEALQAQDEGALNRLLESQLPSRVEQSLDEVMRAVQDRMAAVASAVPAIDATLAGVAQSTQEKMERDLRKLQGKIIQAAKRRDETLRRQYMRARAQAFPDGRPQERVLGFVHFLNHYGPALVDRICEDLPLDIGHHWVMTV